MTFCVIIIPCSPKHSSAAAIESSGAAQCKELSNGQKNFHLGLREKGCIEK